MRILFLTQILPYPLDAGPKIRAYYVLRHLVQHHEVTLVSFVRPDDPQAALNHLQQLCAALYTVPLHRSKLQDISTLLGSLPLNRSWIITRDTNRRMHTFIDRLIQKHKFDYIHADQLSMAQYALAARKTFAKMGKISLVLDQHNAVFTIPSRMAVNSQNPLLRGFMQLESERLRLYEIDACRQFDKVVWVAKHDYQAVFDDSTSQLTSKTEKDTRSSTIIPICVDPYSVEPKPSVPDDPHILFIGGMHWPPNLEGVRWFIKEVFPLIQQNVPKAKFTIIGKLPTRDIINAGGVHAPGFVEDLNPFYDQARLFVVPLLSGGGMRVKILDAWQRALPVVSTAVGAEGLIYSHGKDILIADEPEKFARMVVNLLLDKDTCAQVGSSGRKTVEQNYDWKEIYPTWDQVYRNTNHC